MNKKLINSKKVSKICGNCAHGRHSPDEQSVLCVKHGIMDYYSNCRNFDYDPLNRIPSSPMTYEDYSPEDFAL